MIETFILHILFHLMYFNYRINIALCCSQYYRLNMERINFVKFTI